MKTLVTDSIDEAAAIIRRGGIVAFPTETVYGLGANVFDEGAVARVFEAKGRPADNPLIVHVSDIEQIDTLVNHITKRASTLIDAFFPGPLTLVLGRSTLVPDIVAASLDTVAIRMPANPTARSLIAAAEKPLVAPSANLSGRPSPTTWQAVLEDLDGRIDGILRAERCSIGIESTVVDVSNEPPMILRPGAITHDQLQRIMPDILNVSDGDDRSRHSPGTRHRHYSPLARVVLVTPDDALPDGTDAFIGITKRPDLPKFAVVCKDASDYAARLFEFFRECDRSGLSHIACERVDDDGIGAALMDRLRRAAE